MTSYAVFVSPHYVRNACISYNLFNGIPFSRPVDAPYFLGVFEGNTWEEAKEQALERNDVSRTILSNSLFGIPLRRKDEKGCWLTIVDGSFVENTQVCTGRNDDYSPVWTNAYRGLFLEAVKAQNAEEAVNIAADKNDLPRIGIFSISVLGVIHYNGGRLPIEEMEAIWA